MEKYSETTCVREFLRIQLKVGQIGVLAEVTLSQSLELENTYLSNILKRTFRRISNSEDCK